MCLRAGGGTPLWTCSPRTVPTAPGLPRVLRAAVVRKMLRPAQPCRLAGFLVIAVNEGDDLVGGKNES